MECDPPADYYEAYAKNEANILRLHKFVAAYLADTGRDGISIGPEDEVKVILLFLHTHTHTHTRMCSLAECAVEARRRRRRRREGGGGGEEEEEEEEEEE
jgi:hypothetical protein